MKGTESFTIIKFQMKQLVIVGIQNNLGHFYVKNIQEKNYLPENKF